MGLFRIKRYSDSLFYGHIVLEKALKALVVHRAKREAPYVHDLIKLAQETDLKFEDSELDLMSDVNRFNMRARYPDEKLRFYRQCAREYAKNYTQDISRFYKKLCRKIEEKK